MVLQGHVCGDVFDMCWAHRGASVAEAAAVQQEQPEADLPVKAAAAAAAGHQSSIQYTKLVQCQCSSDVKRQDSNCSLFTLINCACLCFCLSVTHHPSGGVICPTPPGDRE